MIVKLGEMVAVIEGGVERGRGRGRDSRVGAAEPR